MDNQKISELNRVIAIHLQDLKNRDSNINHLNKDIIRLCEQVDSLEKEKQVSLNKIKQLTELLQAG
jgi:hypothetical protein